MTVLGFVLYGSIVMLPIMLQTVMDYSPLQAGYATAPRGLGAFVAMPLVGILMARFDPRKMLALGILIAGSTLFFFAKLNLDAGYWDIFWPQLIQGTSMGLLWVPLTTITMDPIPKEAMGNATSIFSLTRNLGASVGISAATTFLYRRQQFHLNLLSAHVNPYSFQAQQALDSARSAFRAGGSDPFTATQQSYAAITGWVGRQASMLSFIEIFWLLGAVFLLMLPLVLLMKKPGHRSPQEAAAH
jgi:DHA2 family multidrug resistance protein